MQEIGTSPQEGKKYFFLKLLSPRPTFPGDMNEAEAKMMQAHVAYWKIWAEKAVSWYSALVLTPGAPGDWPLQRWMTRMKSDS